MAHPSRHLWPALQRRFTDQCKPSTSPDRLLRALCVVPLEGQEESSVWTLGFKELGSTLRSVSLSRDFGAMSKMVDPAHPCYLVVYVGDVQLEPGKAAAAASSLEPARDWVLISYVPSSCSAFEAKKMADNRAGLKAGLGAERFAEGGMWCVHVEQISLSNYMRASESGGMDAPGAPGASSAAREQEVAASKIQDAMRSKTQIARAPLAAGGGDGVALGGLPGRSLPGLAMGEGLSDATEAIWEERIKGVRHAYNDSCSRLVGALEDLEQTLCNLTNTPYRHDEPLLRARAHMAKNLELQQQQRG